MAEIMLVGNPKKRRRKKGRRRMSAKQRMYFGKRRKRSSRASAAPRRRRRRRNTAVVATNPRRRRRRSYSVVRRRRRNPSFRGGLGRLRSGFSAAGITSTLQAGLIGATGAIGLDLLWGYGSRYLPAQVAGSAIAQYAAKLAGAILVGVIGNMALRGRGRDMAVGATTVVLHDALKAQLKTSFPALALGEYLTYAPSTGSLRRAGPMLSTGMGEYLSGLPNDGGGGFTDEMSYTGEWNGDGMNGY